MNNKNVWFYCHFSSNCFNHYEFWTVFLFAFQHFVADSPIISFDVAAQLRHALIPDRFWHLPISPILKHSNETCILFLIHFSFFIFEGILAKEVSSFSFHLQTTCSYCIITFEPNPYATIEYLEEVVQQIDKLEKSKAIPRESERERIRHFTNLRVTRG